MYINFETIIQVGKVLGALALIGGILISIYNGIPGRMSRMRRSRR